MNDEATMRQGADTDADTIVLSRAYSQAKHKMIESYVLAALEAREKQGLPRYIEDTDLLKAIVDILAPQHASPESAHHKPAA